MKKMKIFEKELFCLLIKENNKIKLYCKVLFKRKFNN